MAAASSSSNAKPPKPRFSRATIKRMMQEDDDVGKVPGATADLVGQYAERFVVELIQKSLRPDGDGNAPKTLSAATIKECVESEPLYDFLRQTVKDAPAPAPKRARSAGSGSTASNRRGKSAVTATGRGAADGGDAADGGGGGGAESAADVAALEAAQYRPLADDDDDYDDD